MRVQALPAVFILVAMIGVRPVAAEQPSYSMEDVTACSRDAIKFCKDKLADLDAIEGCMKENFSKLRPACQARFNHEH